MRKMFNLIGLLSMMVLMSACEENIATEGVLIKIRNNSQYEFQNVFVGTGGGEWEYGPVKANRESEYKPYEFAYRYALVEVTMGGEVYRIQPIDFVGEEKLKPGRYAYLISVLEIENQKSRLSLELRND